MSDIHDSITYNDSRLLKHLLQSGSPYNTNDFILATPLIHAISIDRLDAAKLLLDFNPTLVHQKVLILYMEKKYSPYEWAQFKKRQILDLIDCFPTFRRNGIAHVAVQRDIPITIQFPLVFILKYKNT